MPSVDNQQAEKVLRAASGISSKKDFKPSSHWQPQIQAIISGTHLTYRYILITGLLAKATNASINPLTLQAGSKLPGAYDARSLCHGVIVPLERELFSGGIGGSNEPFLNKPARFPELSSKNAVRRGQDAETLKILLKTLSELTSAKDAYSGLCDAIYYVLKRQKDHAVQHPKLVLGANTRKLIDSFSRTFVEESIEGQTCAVLCGALLDQLFTSLNPKAKVIVHPVNQCGVSSRGIGDIDIMVSGSIYLSLEVKDKSFRKEDVEHAVKTVRKSGLNILPFVMGPRGKIVDASFDTLAKEFSQKYGVDVYFINLSELANIVLSLLPHADFNVFVKRLQELSDAARVKDDVFNRIIETARSLEQ